MVIQAAQPAVYQPIMTRDVTAAAALVAANNPGFGIRMNGTNEHPPFQGFQLTDPLKIESAAKITAMRAQLATTGAGLATHNAYPDTKMNLQPYFFDPSHGVVEKGKALGASAGGGCVMCHSSSDPSSPNYSSNSVGFFDGSQEMLKNGMMQMADYDCGGDDAAFMSGTAGWTNSAHPDWMCGMFDGAEGDGPNNVCSDAEYAMCKDYIAGQLFPMFGMPADIKNAFAIDGVAMMQLMAVREGSSAAGCDPRFQFFGMSDGTGPGTTGCVMGNYFSRDEIRAHFKKNLQQVRCWWNTIRCSLTLKSDRPCPRMIWEQCVKPLDQTACRMVKLLAQTAATSTP